MRKTAILLLMAGILFSCSKKSEDDTSIGKNMTYEILSAEQIEAIMQAVTEIEIPTIDPDEVAVIETKFGRMVIEFDIENAPVHSANFKKLANAGYYDGVTFHRVITGFMLQAGDINSRDDDPTNDGSGGPGYTISSEIQNVHKRGTVGAARTGNNVNPERRSSGSQFYICHVDVPYLDGEYTAYGQVIEGLDVVDKIAAVSTGPGNRPLEDVVMLRVYMTTKSELDN